MKHLIINYVWIHIRQPKLKEKYYHDNLLKELNENGGDIDMLDTW